MRLADQVVQSYVSRTGPSDPRYWRTGAFIATDGPSCWWCYDSAASAAAILATYDSRAANLRQVAIDTFDRAIRSEQLPSGEFEPDGVTTGFFTVDLGLAYLALRKSLDPSTQRAWSTAIGKAADYLIAQGDLSWYANGNINLRQTEVMWLAWVATGNPRFRAEYQREWRFTISPPAGRWHGYGLRVVHDPTQADGDNGAGYLAESGGGAPGFDPNYTMVQLDTATQLYVLTRDPRYVRLMNLLLNQERSRVNSSFTLNATGGSRKSFDTPFMSAAPAVLVLTGQRPGLTDFWLGQLRVIDDQYRNAMHYTLMNFYRGITTWLLMPELTLQWHG